MAGGGQPYPVYPAPPGYGGAGAASNLQAQGYTVIYPSGSLGDLASQLDYWREWRPDILRWAAAIFIFALFAWISWIILIFLIPV